MISSRSRRVWDWDAAELLGLPQADSLALIRQGLGRELGPDEEAAADEIWKAVDGNPLRIKQAAARAKERGQSLRDIARDLREGDPDSWFADLSSAALSVEERRMLTALILLRGSSLGAERLSEIAGSADASALLERLERLGLIESHSPRYSAHGLTVASPSFVVEEEEGPVLSRLLESLGAWAEERQTRPEALLEELPAVLVAIRLAARAGRWKDAIRLGRAVDAALAWSRRWDAWGSTLSLVLEAALRTEDPDTEAWALHQLGTLAASEATATRRSSRSATRRRSATSEATRTAQR